MKKNLYLLFFSCFGYGLLGQNVNSSNQYVSVTGMKYSIIPPKSFVKSEIFNGFENSMGSSIMFVEFPINQNLEELINEISNSLPNVSSKIIEIGPFHGKCFIFDQTALGFSYKRLSFFLQKKDGETIVINGTYLVGDQTTTVEDINKSILTLLYDSNSRSNPADIIDFQVDIPNNEISLAKTISNCLIYTRNGEFPIKNKDGKQIRLFVNGSLSRVEIISKKDYAVKRFLEYPGIENIEVGDIQAVVIDEMEGFEIIGYGYQEEDKFLVYQTILYAPNFAYYMVSGDANYSLDKNLDYFKQICQSFKRKL